jgi:hypothetical protein
MSLGKIRSAERAAQTAVDADRNESRARTILGNSGGIATISTISAACTTI